MSSTPQNLDPEELARFDALAERWWDPDGELKALHQINPLRLGYIDARAPLAGKQVLDVGCGGGLLAEAMAGRGARVTGIDLGEAGLAVARAHARQGAVAIDYRRVAAETLAAERPASFDVVTCSEVLEHVPEPQALVAACARLARPGGHVIFTTINRNPKAFLLAIVAAEHLLGLIPKGTHEYAKLIRPAELAAWARHADLEPRDLTGMTYNPLTRAFGLGRDIDVNYLMHACKS